MNGVKLKASLLPEQPGCYLMKNKSNTVIYVGKAKKLKTRVKTYFQGTHSTKMQHLVMEITDFEFIQTTNEIEALILENQLIKKYKPKFNTLLKDDKQYPYLKITNEKHPRLLVVRSVRKDGAKYYGPYPSSQTANEIKKILDRLFPLRKCDVIPKKECLYYHIGQCLAPCIKTVTSSQNEQMVQSIHRLLKGDISFLKNQIEAKMNDASESLNFELAKEYRDQLLYLGKLRETQSVDSKKLANRDVIGYFYDKGWMGVQVFFIRSGKLLERKGDIFPIIAEPADAFLTYIGQFYDRYPVPSQIELPIDCDETLISNFLNAKCIIPKKGEKKKLVDLAIQNARIQLDQKFKLEERSSKEEAATKELSNILSIPNLLNIEAFDNSNIQGSYAVSAMVCYTKGKPNKQEYRKFKVETVEGSNDFATMKEVLRRRYTRLLQEGSRFPELILVDGGLPQITAAKEVLREELNLSVPIYGMAKDDRHNSANLLDESGHIVPMKKNSPAFFLIQRIQSEVHRFAIEYYRSLHKKELNRSVLDSINGVGSKRKKMLLKHFGSIKKIEAASLDELCSIGIPRKLAQKILNTLKREE